MKYVIMPVEEIKKQVAQCGLVTLAFLLSTAWAEVLTGIDYNNLGVVILATSSALFAVVAHIIVGVRILEVSSEGDVRKEARCAPRSDEVETKSEIEYWQNKRRTHHKKTLGGRNG